MKKSLFLVLGWVTLDLSEASPPAPPSAPPSAPAGFALIPGGSFTMGRTSGDEDDDAPPVTVTVAAFYMGKHEVTKALWDEVQTWGAANGYTDLLDGGGEAANHPVHSITWYSMVKWCNARSQKDGLMPCYSISGTTYMTGDSEPSCNWSASGYRLPTEAEWEKAARGGVSGARYPWGTDTISHARANYFSHGSSYGNLSGDADYHPIYAATDYADLKSPFTSPVGSFPANGYGLYDMTGNVSERCWDWYSSSYYASSPGSDPRGAASGSDRVVRGGSWYNGPMNCRAAVRIHCKPNFIRYNIGFRIARSLTR